MKRRGGRFQIEAKRDSFAISDTRSYYEFTNRLITLTSTDLSLTTNYNYITMCGGDDAIDEDKLILCCALCCINCSILPSCDCFGCSGKVSRRAHRFGYCRMRTLSTHSLIRPRLDSSLSSIGWYMLPQCRVLPQAGSTLPISLCLRRMQVRGRWLLCFQRSSPLLLCRPLFLATKRSPWLFQWLD
jgi:hypothetical protein